MNPPKTDTPQPKPEAHEPGQVGVDKKKNLDLDLKNLLPKLKKLGQKLTAHLPFIVIMFVLLVYLLVVWQIRGLVTAEPAPEDESLALTSSNIPKIDKDAILQIQSLEQNSPQVRALFNEARNNPFNE
ncbi:hypothetical protein HY379_01380 [Candidatus Saccharibacteria bacterium]|nr:hypothetical protein [Candidatus Saccharibacteria bacterium]